MNIYRDLFRTSRDFFKHLNGGKPKRVFGGLLFRTLRGTFHKYFKILEISWKSILEIVLVLWRQF
jgi:hypothetical protein